MLAKEIKIHNLIHQRNFIKAQLEGVKKDGDPAYRYFGYVYSENRKYFESEGYEITTITSVEALKITKGLPLNIFTPFDGIELTPDEETTSQRIATDFSNIAEGLGDFITDLFAQINEEDDSEELDNEDDDIPEEVEDSTDKEEE